jgi:hypothetical protein
LGQEIASGVIIFVPQNSLEKEKECKPPGIIGTLKELKE